MEESKRSIGTEGVGGRRNTASLWNVIIPQGLGREEYIKNCKQTSTVSVMNENAETYDQVKVDMASMQFIKFPKTDKELGSDVMALNIPGKNRIMITGVFHSNDEQTMMTESEAALLANTETGNAEVRAQGGKGEVHMTVDSSNEKGGKMLINISNTNETAEFTVNINGTANVNAGKDISFVSNTGIQAVVQEPTEENPNKITVSTGHWGQKITLGKVNDEDNIVPTVEAITKQGTVEQTIFDDEGNISYSIEITKDGSTEKFYKDGADGTTITKDAEEVIIAPKKSVSLGSGKEPLVLGDTVAKIIKNVLDQIYELAVENAGEMHTATPQGGPTTPPINASKYAKIAIEIQKLGAEVDSVKSKTAFTG